MESIEELREIVLKSNAVKQMIDTEGWRILDEIFKKYIETLKEKLIRCEDEDITKIRQEIKFFRTIFNTINFTLQSGKISEEKIEELEMKY